MTAHAVGIDPTPERVPAVRAPDDDAARAVASDGAAPARLTMVGGAAPGCVGDACEVPGANGW